MYWNFRGGRDVAIRNAGWKLIENRENGARSQQLFNVERDPYEKAEVSRDHQNLFS